jgi:glycosyltransferase involved in cell wall biosynthesis
MAKTLSVGVPCYNSAAYMDRAIGSILVGASFAEDIEVIVVDDGSTKDNTFEKAQEWEQKYPGLVKAIHQENGGHGIAVLTALDAAEGTYFKVCDSDDWYDAAAMQTLMTTLRGFLERDERVDLVVTNYVYENVDDNESQAIDYKHALPVNKLFTWDDMGHFSMSQNLLMHSLCYRTDILRDGGVPMPAHTFYVDNIYAYVPLPRVKSLYYLDIDLYRYLIGRDDQSVNETVMAGRIDMQHKITRIMIDAYHLDYDVTSPKLREYMEDYLAIMMMISSIFALLSDVPLAREHADELWEYLKGYDAKMYRHCRRSVAGIVSRLPGKAGERTTIGLYHLARKVVKFN